MKATKISLLKALTADLNELCFKLIKTKEWFIKRNKESLNIFWITFYNDPDGLRVTPTAAIRFHKVEEIFHLSSNFPRKYQNDTHTIVSEIWRWLGSKDSYQYKIRSDSDIVPVARNLILDFNQKALNYFQKYSSLKQIDSLLNDDPHQDSVHQIMDYARCSRGIITAKLCHRDNYHELASIYRERMRKQDKGFYLDLFENLLTHLNHY
jgi:hypothetical protein